MKPLFPIIITLLLSLSFSIAYAGPIEKNSEKETPGIASGAVSKLTVRVNGSEISVAESLDLTIEVIEPAGVTAELPSFNELGFATDFTERSQRFRVTDISELVREKQADGSNILTQHYTLEPFLSGDYAILPIMVTFHNSDQETDVSQLSKWRTPLLSLMTDGIRVKVTPLPADRRDLSDLLGQVDLEQANLLDKERRTENKSDQELRREEEEKNETASALKERRFPWWIIWVLLFIIAAVPIGWYLGRKKIKKFLAKKRIPPHLEALSAFDELKKRGLLQKGMIKEFYYELSYILRRYIGGRFNISADKQTTEEFFQQLLKNNPFDKMAEQILRDFAELADTVKYSLFRPDSHLGDESFQIAKSFVNNTKPSAEESK
jgi:hypothetical protein